MKGSLIAFDTLKGRGAAAWVQDGKLHDFLIDPPEDRIAPGAIFRAKAGRPMKGQGGMILETPSGPLFLRQTKGLSPGDTLLVQTTTYADRGKAAPCGTRLMFKSRYLIVTPGAPGLNISRSIKDEEAVAALKDLINELIPDTTEFGAIVRSAAEGVATDDLKADFQATIDLARQVLGEPKNGAPECLLEGPDAETLAWQNWPAPDVNDAASGSFARNGILDDVEALLRAHVSLDREGRFYVEATRALVAIDVNTGADTSVAAGLKTNIAAMRAIPKALRLRGLGGQIVIDFAPFAKRDRTQVEQIAQRALKADGIETNVVGWTPLGHLELQRKRERLPLHEALK